MNNTKSARNRSLNILHLCLHSRGPWPILRILLKQRNMTIWHNPPNHTNSNSILRLCPSMRTNIILSSNRNHKSPHRYPIPRDNNNNLVVRGICNQRPNTNPIFRTSLYSPIRNYLTIIPTYYTPSRRRLQQPTRD